MRLRLPFVVVLFATLATAPDVVAQTEGLFAVGGSATVFDPPDPDVGRSVGVGAIVQLKPRQGWGPVFGLGWFESELHHEMGGRRQMIGRVRVRPMMAGCGYTVVRGPWAIGAAALGGYASNSGRVSESLRREADAAGVEVALDARDSLVARPTLSVTYSLAPRIGLTGTAAYLFVDPQPYFTMDGATIEDGWQLRSRMFSVGLVYSFF